MTVERATTTAATALALALLLGVSAAAAPAASGRCTITGGTMSGHCAGVITNEKGQAGVRIHEPVSISGIIQGATIADGGVLNLSGISRGDIIVEAGGRFRLFGVVHGTVRNLGGHVLIRGTVDHLNAEAGRTELSGTAGSVSGDGSVRYLPGAVVGSTPVDRGGVERDDVTAAASGEPIVLTLGGTDGVGFAGECSFEVGVETVTERLEGRVPARYEFAAPGLRCTLQKTTAKGRLDISARKGSSAVSNASTTGQRGSININVR